MPSLYLKLGCPDLDAQLMFETDEWKAAYVLNQKKLPDKPHTLNEVVRLVPRLVAFWHEKVMVSPEPRPSGWACSAFLTSPLELDSQASFRRRGLVYNEMA